jgi:ElaB/YqjD/DUF883 family membrane-anchored ribosome-binding protein
MSELMHRFAGRTPMATAPKKSTAASSPKRAKAGRRKKAGSKKRAQAARAGAVSRNANSALGDIESLRDDLIRLSRSVSSLMTSRATEARDLVTERATDLYDTGVDYARDAETNVRGVASDIAKQVEKNPLAAIGIVLGVGYVIGLLRRR